MSFSFSQSKQKQIVGVSLTPGIGLEAVILDKSNSQVLKYGKRDVEYSFSTREIQEVGSFKSSFSSLMSELGVTEKTPVYFVLPNVLFDFMEYPADLGDEAVKTMILSRAEDFYLFKKEEPQSGWCEVPNKESENQKKLVYTSFQKSTVDIIRETVEDLKLELVGIESAYSATLRGLSIAGQLEDIMLEEAPWTMMLINTNSYTMFYMEADRLVACNEVPLALRSFSMEEAYQAIVSSSSQLLANYPSSKLFIVSQTDDISSDALKRNLGYSKEVVAIDSNKYSKDPIIQTAPTVDYEDAKFLTLSAIGAACPKCDFHLTLNVLQSDVDLTSGVYKIVISDKTYELTYEQVLKALITAAIIAALVFAIIAGGFFILKSNSSKTIEELNSQISQKQAAIDALSTVEEEKKPEIDMTSVIDEVAEMNVSAINFYDSISADIPKKIWLTKYYNVSGNKIVIRGVAENIVDIYEYYKNLKVLSPQSDIKLAELRVIANDGEGEEDLLKNLNVNADSDRLYSFEISNTVIGDIQQSNQNSEGKPSVDENNLLKAPPSQPIEEPSQQMTETN